MTEPFGTDWISAVYEAVRAAARDKPWDGSALDRVFEAYRASEHAFRTSSEDARRHCTGPTGSSGRSPGSWPSRALRWLTGAGGLGPKGQNHAMKFVLAFYGTRGDVEPGVAVGRELLRRGHDVRMAVPPDLVGFAEAAGLAAVAYGPDVAGMAGSDAQLLDVFLPQLLEGPGM